MVCEVSCKDNTYTIKYKYLVLDYYEWGYHDNGDDYEKHMLHEYGFAREYPISWVYESKMTWTKGERFGC